MEKMNNADYQLFTTIARMKQKNLMKSLKKIVKKYYQQEDILFSNRYILCKGNIPVLLVAHMDTVFKSPPDKIYYDQHQRVIWSPDGLGADDRAGVFAILKILSNGFLPHICFTTDEEVGGIGARALIKDMPTTTLDIKYAIQLDRQGIADCVFYSCDNEKFEEFIEKYNFITDWGTFSDISIICPAWKVAGVNLSVGYFDEHSIKETLHTDALYATINKVEIMLNEIEQAPYFEYIETPYEKYWNKLSQVYGWDFYDEEDYWYSSYGRMYPTGPCKCSKCGRNFTEDDVFLVKSKDSNEKKKYCVDCVSLGVNWCERCGEPFEASHPKAKYCNDCAKSSVVL